MTNLLIEIRHQNFPGIGVYQPDEVEGIIDQLADDESGWCVIIRPANKESDRPDNGRPDDGNVAEQAGALA